MSLPKMHLVARVPNEGARLLAWALGTNPRLWDVLTDHGIGRIKIDRLLAGELTPGGIDGTVMMLRTKMLIRAHHWNQAPLGGWFERPAQFEDAAATAEALAA